MLKQQEQFQAFSQAKAKQKNEQQQNWGTQIKMENGFVAGWTRCDLVPYRRQWHARTRNRKRGKGHRKHHMAKAPWLLIYMLCLLQWNLEKWTNNKIKLDQIESIHRLSDYKIHIIVPEELILVASYISTFSPGDKWRDERIEIEHSSRSYDRQPSCIGRDVCRKQIDYGLAYPCCPKWLSRRGNKGWVSLKIYWSHQPIYL